MICLLTELIGRPPVEAGPMYGNFLADLQSFVDPDSAANSRRRSDIVHVRRNLTVNTVLEHLQNLGYNIGRSTVYSRFAPKRHGTHQALNHRFVSNTLYRMYYMCLIYMFRYYLDINFSRPEEKARKYHPGLSFYFATARMMNELASALGPDALVFGVDDKAKVPLGIAAANKQGPTLQKCKPRDRSRSDDGDDENENDVSMGVIMAMMNETKTWSDTDVGRVRLPDHSFTHAAKHKLTPSVYALQRVIENNPWRHNAVKYDGATAVYIRSSKHNGSNAFTHAEDIKSMLVDLAPDTLRIDESTVRPCWFIRCDGGADNNIRHVKVIRSYVELFKKYDLDFLIVTMPPAGNSAFNPVERRMAPLSRLLVGVLFHHLHFGNHLNRRGETIDDELEWRNFKAAMEALAECFSHGKIKGKSIFAKAVTEDSDMLDTQYLAIDWDWLSKHARFGERTLQFSKCDGCATCGPIKSTYRKHLNGRRYFR